MAAYDVKAELRLGNDVLQHENMTVLMVTCHDLSYNTPSPPHPPPPPTVMHNCTCPLRWCIKRIQTKMSHGLETNK